MSDRSELPASPLHALCVYAEPLVAGHRVLVLGDATRRLGERFLELGARVVHLYDPQPARAAAHAERAPRGLTVLPLPAAEFDVRDGAFDLAVILDLADFSAPGPLLARVRRLLATGGTALIRSRSAEGSRGRPRSQGNAGAQSAGPLDYYELYDLVAMQFTHVRMVGQVAWSGVALAELGRDGDELDVTVDTQLVTEPSAPEAFIAIGAQEDVRLAEYALVQIPLAPTVDVETTVAYGSEKADLAAAQLRASLLDAQLEELRAQRNRDAVSHSDTLGALESELAERLSQLQSADSKLADAAAWLEQARTEGRARDEEIARLRDRATLGLRELEDERRARARIEHDLQASRANLEATAHDARILAGAVDRVPALEHAVVQLEAAGAGLAQRLAATEEARALLEGERTLLAHRLLEAEQSRAILEAALHKARTDHESLRRAHDEEAKKSSRVVVVTARVAELEAIVASLEAAVALHDAAVAKHDAQVAARDAQVAARDAEVGTLSQGHEQELMALERALRERAKAAQGLEEEVARRERIILDLVHALEEARAAGDGSGGGGGGGGGLRDAAREDAERALREARQRADRARAEGEELRARLDAAALEIARREAEGTTTAWRIQELEQTVSRLEDEQSELTMTIPPPAFVSVEREANDVTVLSRRLIAAEDELDLVRQALAQEHEARARAESGEALAQARTELARQAALLEQLSRELDAHDGARRGAAVSDANSTARAEQR